MFNQAVIAATDPSNALSLWDSIWLILVFILLVLAVKHYAWGPVNKMLEQRRQKIISDLDEADANNEQAKALARQRQQELQNSKSQALTIINEANENSEKQRQVLVKAAENDAQKIREKAQADALQAQRDALKEARNDVAGLAVDIAQNLIKKELTADDQSALIDAYIERLMSTHENK